MFASPVENTAYLLSLRYLKFRPRSVKEIRDYLHKKQVNSAITEKIIKTLSEQKFLNDEEFANMWVRSRKSLKPKSNRVLSLELKQKGISQDIINDVLEKSAKEQGSDLEIARVLVEKRKEKYKGLSKEEIYKKLGGFLARRGFNYDAIKTVIDDNFPS